MHPFTTIYTNQALPKLKESFSYASPYLIPRVEKVVVNVGVGDCVGNQKALEEAIAMVTAITGQKPLQVKARKSIAGFKIRENMIVGLKVTLRGERMNDFLMKLTQVVLPRTRDFRGITASSVSKSGDLHIGIRDSLIFPETAMGGYTHGIQVSLVSTAKNTEEARVLFESLGFVFRSAEDEASTKKPNRARRSK